MLEQLGTKGAEVKDVVLLFMPFDWGTSGQSDMSVRVARRRSGRNLAGGVETFVGDGVPAAIIDFADEALSAKFAPDILDGMMMGWV